MIVGTDLRHFAVAGRAVDGNAFTKCIFIADFGSGQAALPFQVLRLESNAREREKFVAASDSSMAIDDHMWMQSATRAQNDVLADDTIGPDLAVYANLRLGMYDRRRMDHRIEP
jgi:hypothetical protein